MRRQAGFRRTMLIGQLQNLCCRRRVERRGVLVKQQQLRLLQRRPSEVSVPAAGRRRAGRPSPVMRSSSPSPKRVQPLIDTPRALAFVTPHSSVRFLPRRSGQRQVFLDLHVCGAVPSIGSWNTRPMNCRAACTPACAVTSTPSRRMRPESTGQTPAMAFRMRRFAGAVAADDGHEIAVGFRLQGQTLSSAFLALNGAGVERLRDIGCNVKHGGLPPFVSCGANELLGSARLQIRHRQENRAQSRAVKSLRSFGSSLSQRISTMTAVINHAAEDDEKLSRTAEVAALAEESRRTAPRR